MTARPETLIHGQEGRVNTGWPPPHFVQKSPSVMGKSFVGRVDKAAPGPHDDIAYVRILTERVSFYDMIGSPTPLWCPPVRVARVTSVLGRGAGGYLRGLANV